MTIISIHQPVYLPWIGFIDKLVSSDVFVFLDDVQYEKNGFQNRNKIKTESGEMWLTIPTSGKSKTLLKDVKVDNTSRWEEKHLKSIVQNYSKAQFFNKYWKEMNKFYEKSYEYLIDFNMEIILFLMKNFKIKTKILFSSELEISKKGSERILDICKSLNAEEYISGIGGKNYLNVDDFNKNNIKIKFQKFKHPIYNQSFESFIPNLAAIDLLFNEGENSVNIINQTYTFNEINARDDYQQEIK